MHLWRQATEAARAHENLCVTLCGPHPAALRHICGVAPLERILWGSDHVFGGADVLGYRKRMIDALDLSPAAHAAIMGGDIWRLLR